MASSNSISDSFTTSDFIDKIKETIGLAREITQHPSSKKNQKIQDLLKMQCYDTLKILTKLNQNHLNQNSRDCDFTRLKFDDQQKISKLIEIDDALIDKTMHYFECVQNLKEKNPNPNLIQVQMNVNTQKNDSKIFIKDYKYLENKSDILRSAKFIRKYSDNNNRPSSSTKNFMFMAASNVKRPQIVYKIKVDNSYSTPFIPKLTRKPNAKLPLEESLKPIAQPNITLPNSVDKNGISYPSHYYPHPYQYEIENFTVPSDFFNQIPTDLKKPSSLAEAKFIFINKREDLQELIQVLKNYKEIAVDLEHHSFRSYQGLTCLLQISTDDTDYIIDVFPLWNDIEIMNEIFTSPSILKVFHSSHFDMIWLQRDLGIYVVNLFDTWIAATTLGYKHVSLSSLVSHLCDFQLDKRLQLADWRIRPIPEEMLQYARCDTHFLLYIYRCLKKELLNASDKTANLLRVVMERSQQMCLKRYEKKLPEINDHVHLLWKNNLRFNLRQMAALKSLYSWRDIIARHEDESTGYVLPNNLLLKICEILPREQQGILACCNPIPPLVRQYINEIHKIILSARSRVLMDQHLDTKIALQEKNDITIDLTNDLLIDHSNLNKSMKMMNSGHAEHHNEHDEHGQHDQEDHDIPLLRWSTETGKFISNEHHSIPSSSSLLLNELNQDYQLSFRDDTSMDIDMDDQHYQSSIIDMFDIPSSKHPNKKHDQQQKEGLSSKKTKTNVNMENLFTGYITFYQRYLIKKKQKESMEIS